jgi:hypothetical protein
MREARGDRGEVDEFVERASQTGAEALSDHACYIHPELPRKHSERLDETARSAVATVNGGHGDRSTTGQQCQCMV